MNLEIHKLVEPPSVDPDSKLTTSYRQLEKLLAELGRKNLPDHTVEKINKEVIEINSFLERGHGSLKSFKKSQSRILVLIKEELQLVPKNHYRNLWLAIGMAAMGIPFGIVYGLLLDNMAFMSIGLPIGMGIGIAIGTSKDKKAMEEGKQLEFETT